MKPGPARGSFVVAAEAARCAFSRAAQVRPQLGSRDHRVLEAAVSLIALYSRTEDRIYLGQLAAQAFGVEESDKWQQKKTGDALRRLATAGVLVVEAPRGRPAAPAYVVRFPMPATPDMGAAGEDVEAPGAGVATDVAPPGAGVAEDDAAAPVVGAADEQDDTLENASDPRRGSLATPAVSASDPCGGAPTGEYPGEYPEVGNEADASTDPKALAKTVVNDWWEQRKAEGNPVGQPWIACAKVVEAMLKQGVPRNRIEFALRDAPVVSAGALEMSIQKEVKRLNGSGPIDKRDARIVATQDPALVAEALGLDRTKLAVGSGR